MNGAEMIDSTDDSALWLTVGEGEDMEDGSTLSVDPICFKTYVQVDEDLRCSGQLGCLTRSELFNIPAIYFVCTQACKFVSSRAGWNNRLCHFLK